VLRQIVPLVLGLLLSVAGARSAASQRLHGRLLDVVTEQPLAGGIISLLYEDGTRLVSTTTDERGAYRLRAPRAGRFLVEARRIGYETWLDGPIDLAAGDDWDTLFRLSAIAIALPPVAVEGPAVTTEAYLRGVGFYDRRRADFGYFLMREQIVARAAQRVSDLLAAMPGVRVVPGAAGLGRTGIEFSGSLLSVGPCHPRVFVDGLMVIRGDARPRGLDVEGLPEEPATETGRALRQVERPEIALDDVVHPADIEALEVYRRGSQVPVRFGGTSTSTQCGVLVIWTRRGRSERE
jgi:Carboxypeptidase regulatory-like domain